MEDTSKSYLWYHDIKWTIPDAQEVIIDPPKLKLVLSDRSEHELKIDSLEILRQIIRQIESTI